MTNPLTSIAQSPEKVKPLSRQFVAMSFSHVRDSTLKDREFRVLAYIASYDWDGKGCWVDQETMAHECGMSPRTLYSAIKELDRKALITKKRTQNGNRYYVTQTRRSEESDTITVVPSEDENPPYIRKARDLNRKTPNSVESTLQQELLVPSASVADCIEDEIDNQVDHLEGDSPDGPHVPLPVVVALTCITLNKEPDFTNKGKYIKMAIPLAKTVPDVVRLDKLLRWEASKPQFRRGRVLLTPKIAYEDTGKWLSMGEPETYDGRPTVTVTLSDAPKHGSERAKVSIPLPEAHDTYEGAPF